MINERLIVGVIQTSLDSKAAWKKGGVWQDVVQMSSLEEIRAKKEIRHYFASLRGLDLKPDIVLLPELSVPLGYQRKLTRIAEKLECIVIAGLDYRIRDHDRPSVSNEAIVIVPKRLKGKKIASQTAIRHVGKTYGAPGEIKLLSGVTPGVSFLPNPTVWLFQSVDLGNFGVAVCYDFMDIDRMVLYRNKVHTLFILAYNRDITSFDHVAESIARTVFCNVVVCNCGYYGGSVAVSPYTEPYKRTVYRHSGNNLPNVQLIELPLKSLATHQSGTGGKSEFKSLPPGFQAKLPLTVSVKTI